VAQDLFVLRVVMAVVGGSLQLSRLLIQSALMGQHTVMADLKHMHTSSCPFAGDMLKGLRWQTVASPGDSIGRVTVESGPVILSARVLIRIRIRRPAECRLAERLICVLGLYLTSRIGHHNRRSNGIC
jgi:hypothetical protein